MRELIKYQAVDGKEFDDPDEARRYETSRFNAWLTRKDLGSFICDADDEEGIDSYRTQREERRVVMRELFEHLHGGAKPEP